MLVVSTGTIGTGMGNADVEDEITKPELVVVGIVGDCWWWFVLVVSTGTIGTGMGNADVEDEITRARTLSRIACCEVVCSCS